MADDYNTNGWDPYQDAPWEEPQPVATQPQPAEQMTGGTPGQQPQERTLSNFQPASYSVPPAQRPPQQQQAPSPQPQQSGPVQLPQIYNAGVLQQGPNYTPQQRAQLLGQGYTADQVNQLSQGATTMQLANLNNQRQQRLAQIGQQLSQEPLSMEESQRLSMMKSRLSAVQEAVNNGTLLPHEGDEAFLMLQGGIDPLQRRQQAASAAAQEQQNQQRQQELDRQIQESQTRREREAAGLPATTGRVQVAPGIWAYGFRDDKGQFHQLNPQHLIHDGPDGRLPVGTGAGTSSSGSSGTGAARGQEVTANRTAQVLQHVERSVDAELKAEFQNSRPADYEDQRAARISARLPRAIEHFRQLQQGLNPPPVDPRDQPLSEQEAQRLSHLRGRYLTWGQYQRNNQRWPETPEDTQHWQTELRTLEERHGLQAQRGVAERVRSMIGDAFQQVQGAQHEFTTMQHNQERIPAHERNLTDLRQRAQSYAQAQLRLRAINAIHQLLANKARHTWTQQDTLPIRQMLPQLDEATRNQLNQALRGQ